jgi:hypothetical protein
MDEETRAYLDRMMTEINNGFERLLDRMSNIRADTDDTRGHVLYGLRENLTLSERITRLENDRRKP